MNKLNMKKYGVILTDRTLGKRIASQILEQESFPVFLNFKGFYPLDLHLEMKL